MNIIIAAAFLFLKTGEKFATQDAAGATLAGLTSYLGTYEPHVFNTPAKAVEFCTAKKPPVGIVTPGFYLAYAKALGMEAVLETKRTKVPEERYALVAKKDAGDDFHEKIIATTLAAEERYVTGVILRGQFGDVRLKAVTDVEGAVFDLAEGAKGAADGVLMEAAQWTVFKDDPELSPKLRAVLETEPLPRSLVVVFRDADGKMDFEKLKTTLKTMNDSEAGKAILQSIRVDAFVDLDKERLARAEAKFLGK